MYNWDTYDDLPEYHPIADANNLYEGYKAARKGSHWKTEVQRFRWNWSVEIRKLQIELDNYQHDRPNSYQLMDYSRFEVRERGKVRPITALRMRDRVVKHVLNDLYLIPNVRPHLIYDNGASLKWKGVDFTRHRLIAHLESYYRKYNANQGYIRLMDFSGFYDNIDHAIAMAMMHKYVPDEFALKLVKQAYDSYDIDVSFMSDGEYEIAKNSKFNLVEYRTNGHGEEKRGLKYLYKSMSVGDQTSQITAIAFPTGIDKRITIVDGQKYYARYMDDSYIICRDKADLKRIGRIFDETAKRYKLFINPRKTQIFRLDRTFKFMQFRYYLAANGHVVVRISKKTVTRMRRKLKKLAKRVQNGKTSLAKVEELFRSWIGNYGKIMSKRQTINIVTLYRSLFGGGLDEWMKDRHIL